MRVKIRISLGAKQCLVCGKRVGFLRSLTGDSLCCTEHEQQILDDLRALAGTRIENPVAETDEAGATPV